MAKKPAKESQRDAKAASSGPTPIFGLRLPLDMKEALDRLAVEDERTLSGYIIKVLSDHLKAKGVK